MTPGTPGAVARQIALGLGRAAVVLWLAFTASFVLLYALPASPVELLFPADERTTVDAETYQRVAAQYGFDQPVVVQYLQRLVAALQGDLGASVQTGKPVVQAIAEVLPNTVVLAAAALLLAVLLAFVVAVTAAWLRSDWLRDLIESIPPLLVSLPNFLVGLLLIHLFAFQLGWFPSLGGQGLHALVLPALTLAIPIAGPIAQLLVSSFRRELASPYVETSLGKGLTRVQVLLGDVFKNASLPAVTQAGIIAGEILAGAVLTETIFSRGGLGRLTEEAIRDQDIPVVQGIVLFAAVVFVVVNLLVDLLYPLLDPRIRASAGRAERGLVPA